MKSITLFLFVLFISGVSLSQQQIKGTSTIQGSGAYLTFDWSAEVSFYKKSNEILIKISNWNVQVSSNSKYLYGGKQYSKEQLGFSQWPCQDNSVSLINITLTINAAGKTITKPCSNSDGRDCLLGYTHELPNLNTSDCKVTSTSDFWVNGKGCREVEERILANQNQTKKENNSSISSNAENSKSNSSSSSNTGNTNISNSSTSSPVNIPQLMSAEENMRQVGIDPNTDYMGNATGLLGNMFAENQRRDEQRQNERDARAYENYQEEKYLISLRDQGYNDFNNGRVDNIYSLALKGLASTNKKYEIDFLALAILGGVFNKKFQEAINYGLKLKEHSRYGEVGVNDRFAVELYMGIAYHSLEKYEQSIASYANAKSLDDKFTLVNQLMGAAYLELKKYPEAVTAFTHELEITPFDILSLKGRAKAKSYLKDYEGALNDYTLGIDNTAEKVSFYELRAELKQTKLKDYQGAISDYTKLIEIGNDKSIYFQKRGGAHLSNSAYDQAFQDYSTAIELNPNGSWYYYDRAYIFMNKKRDFVKAVEDLNKAVELNPAAAQILYRRAQVFKMQKNYTRAVLDYTKLIEKENNSSLYNYELAKIYYLRLNDSISARPYFEKALEKLKVEKNEIRIIFCNLFLGNIVSAEQDLNKKIEETTDPKYKRQLLYCRAEMYAILKKETKALAQLEELLKTGYKLDPYEVQFVDNLCFISEKPSFKTLINKYHKP